MAKSNLKILHVLETSKPHTVGYTVRASSIIENQRLLGLDPVVVTSPFFPAAERRNKVDLIDGVRYYRTNKIPVPATARSKLTSYAVRILMMARYRRAILEVALKERPDVVHAHSSYVNAYAAIPAARRLGVPLVYEVRTLWGESAVVEDGLRPDSWKHKLVWRLEVGAMRRADLVIPISQGIREELIERGISASKLEIVPNGVDTARFVPVPQDVSRANAFGLGGLFVVGFIGSIRKLEGLSTLLEAYAICGARRSGMGVVIVGDGPDRKALEIQASKMGLQSVVFTGNVPHSDVSSWYSTMDLLVYPRIRAVINERVTPLKPLEAMALGKVCVGSDVGGLTELIEAGKTGEIFRSEDPEDLATVMLSLMDDRERMKRLSQAAITFVKAEREWSKIAERYGELYDLVLDVRKGTPLGSNGKVERA